VSSPPFSCTIPRRQPLLWSWPTVQVDAALILAASKLEGRHSFSFWDALIVEAARRAGATRLLTEDLQAGRQLDGIRIDNLIPAAWWRARRQTGTWAPGRWLVVVTSHRYQEPLIAAINKASATETTRFRNRH